MIECEVDPEIYGGRRDIRCILWKGRQHRIRYVSAVASNYHELGYRFVPLVREKISLACSLNILFLRRDSNRWRITSAGDIDNRKKRD